MTGPAITRLRAGATAAAVLLLAGCGAWQATKDTTAQTAHAVFIAKVKQMHLAVAGDAELNRDARGASLPVSMRVYQLKDVKAFEQATYAQLLHAPETVLKADALYRTELTLAPSASVALDAPMAADARYVGVVAFFRDPASTQWRLVIPASQWKKAAPVNVHLIGNTVTRDFYATDAFTPTLTFHVAAAATT